MKLLPDKSLRGVRHSEILRLPACIAEHGVQALGELAETWGSSARPVAACVNQPKQPSLYPAIHSLPDPCPLGNGHWQFWHPVLKLHIPSMGLSASALQAQHPDRWQNSLRTADLNPGTIVQLPSSPRVELLCTCPDTCRRAALRE